MGDCINDWEDDCHGDKAVESQRFFLARRTVLEMLRDRGYNVPANELFFSLTAFREAFPALDLDRLRVSASLAADPSKKVLVIFCGPEPIKLPIIRSIYAQVKDENLTRLILVIQSKVTPKARDTIKEIFKFKVETFQISELLANITKHVLMPRHDILTKEEKQELLKKYNIQDSQLPRMLESDAVARYYGVGRGQVVKVTYDGEFTGSHVTYRCVV